MTPTEHECQLADTAARVIVHALETGLTDTPEKLVPPEALQALARVHLEMTTDVALPAPRVDHEPPRTASTREEAPRRRAREHAPQFSPNLARIASCACGWRPVPDTPDTDVAHVTHVTHALAAEGRLP